MTTHKTFKAIAKAAKQDLARRRPMFYTVILGGPHDMTFETTVLAANLLDAVQLARHALSRSDAETGWGLIAIYAGKQNNLAMSAQHAERNALYNAARQRGKPTLDYVDPIGAGTPLNVKAGA